MKIEKRGYFQKLNYIALQKFQALRLLGLDIFPDPTVICNPTFIREIRVVFNDSLSLKKSSLSSALWLEL